MDVDPINEIVISSQRLWRLPAKSFPPVILDLHEYNE